ncbi:MAG TPA: mechanosensitive ion channel domain-containing protein [Casimicrobiaceae bacterium]
MTRACSIAILLATTVPFGFACFAHADVLAPLQPLKPNIPAQSLKAAAEPDTASRLATVRAMLANLERPGAVTDGSPPDTPDGEIGDRMRLLHQLDRSLSQRIEGEARYAALVRVRRDAEARADEWRGFSDPPPYPLPFVDSLEQAEETIAQQGATIEARETVLNGLVVRLQRRLRDSEAELRQTSERIEKARDDKEQRRAKWLHDLAQLRSEEAAAALDDMQQGLANVAEEKGAANAELRLAKAKVAAARADTRFTKDDLDRIDARLAGDAKALAGDLTRATAARNDRSRASDGAANRLAEARKAGTGASETPETFAARIDALEREADLAKQRAENARIALEGAKTQIALVDYERKAWATRYEITQSKNLAREASAYENMIGSLTALQAWNEYQKQQLDTASSFVATLETKLRGVSSEDAPAVRELRDIYVQREGILRNSLSATQPLERLLSRWRSNMVNADASGSLFQRAADAWIVAKLWVKRVWAYELFSVEDSFETADGRKIAGRRSVTIGKTLGAALLIIMGSWLCVKLAHITGWAAVTLLRQTPAYANVVHRWTLALLVALLVVASLLTVDIPLTVFAFMGGALAIGVGFGAQNLLKNLMSGVMLLLEKPLRVGDLIEFGGVRGRVTNIGFRASIVRTGDGIETLIPNSTFIESNVTNLTYSSTQLRQQIGVGVAYGAEPAKVREALLAVAAEHPAVLKDPPPAAYFDDFGDDAQKFRLTYWIDIAPELDSARVATELREQIVQRLTAAGFSIPFPHRTLRLDAPVRVEIAPAPNAP